MVRHRFLLELEFHNSVREIEALQYVIAVMDNAFIPEQTPRIVKKPDVTVKKWAMLREMIEDVGRKRGLQPGAKIIAANLE